MDRKLQVVPGGTSGMGLATAVALGKFGPVLVGGRNEKRLESALKTLKEAGVEAYGKQLDISDRESMKAFASELIWKINVQGTINVVEAFLPYLDHSCVVNYSSITGYFYQPSREELAVWSAPDAPDFFEKSFAIASSKELDERMKFQGPQFLAYIASKRFVIYYTQANALRFGRKNSQIFSVAPGSFDTPMLREISDPAAVARIEAGTAFGRLGAPEEMADFITCLLQPGHQYLTGCDLILDGGKSAMVFAKQYE